MPEIKGYNPHENYSTDIKTGVYLACVVEADTVQTKGGEAQTLVFQILEGEYKGKNVRKQYYCTEHPTSDMAKTIACAAIKSFNKAAGCPESTNTDDLLNKPFMIRVVVKPQRDNPEYNDESVSVASEKAIAEHNDNKPLGSALDDLDDEPF